MLQYGERNGWSDFTLEETELLEDIINAAYRAGVCGVNDMIMLFEHMDMLLFFNAPGAYGKFLADTPYNVDIIEEWAYAHD